MRKLIIMITCFWSVSLFAQELKLKKRSKNALSGTEFANSIADTSLSLVDREKKIFEEVRSGNIPSFLRNLKSIQIKKVINTKIYILNIYTLTDYLAIGTDSNFFYIPTTPMLAQQIADLTNSILPTKTMVDEIFANAKIKLAPQPITPSKAMTTVPVFIAHNQMVLSQLEALKQEHIQPELTAGNKKDIIISNKIYGQPSPRVVIYGWHKLDGKPIQPVYNKHTNTWADYSHGVRLVSNIGYLNGKRVKLSDLLKDPVLHELLSDEGVIPIAKYPTN
ncbi:hypothetical protein [Pedobacter sp. SL55]|uniref:hypothetical protein n=1 Tax=Pedobacter sp. SL55 TaxID=2995161 RepID=UPI0022720B6F|nr:hypothetical protein [Pedobacter sp. SL55]WAC39971.1 hypothetical protein OVA16_15490 [Pedobacter sp. SL55]